MLAGLALALLALVLALYPDGAEEAPPAVVAPQEQPKAAETNQVDKNAPAFDVVRIGEDGNAVMAGRAPAGSVVVIYDDVTEIGRVTADDRGEWVFVPDISLSPGARQLKLKSILADGTEIWAETPVILVVPEGKGGALAFRSGANGHEILQGPSGQSGPVVMDLVTQSKDGLHVSGRGEPDGRVFLYGDGKFLGEATISPKGQWSLTTKAEPKVLRADLVDQAGKVVGRVEIPTDGAPLPDGLKIENGNVVVQQGASLWRIAQSFYGSGLAYTLIFEANQSQIRDPDLIYPGQIFQLPASKGSKR